jgi:hypothetical protein
MAMQAPTRITIEVHPQHGGSGEQPIVRVVPQTVPFGRQTFVAAEPREDISVPPRYESGPCLCLDDADCGADHAND